MLPFQILEIQTEINIQNLILLENLILPKLTEFQRFHIKKFQNL